MRRSKKNSKRKLRNRSRKLRGGDANSSPIFFQKQKDGLGCGRIAINNIAGMKDFVIEGGNVPNFNEPTFPINMKLFCNEITKQYKEALQSKGITSTPGEEIADIFECKDNEDYNLPVLQSAMGLIKYKTEGDYNDLNKEIISASFLTTESESSRDNYVYLFNIGGSHWTSAKKVGNAYYYFDGYRKSENALPEKYLSLIHI